jgi:hypothetical protein
MQFCSPNFPFQQFTWRPKVGVFLVWHKTPQIWNGSWPSSSGLRGHRRTNLTNLKGAWPANFKMVWYVLLRPRRPELDAQDPFQICGVLCQTRKTPTLAALTCSRFVGKTTIGIEQFRLFLAVLAPWPYCWQHTTFGFVVNHDQAGASRLVRKKYCYPGSPVQRSMGHDLYSIWFACSWLA